MGHFDRYALERLVRGDGWDAKRWAMMVWTLLCLEIWWDNYRTRVRSASRATIRDVAAGRYGEVDAR